MVSCEQAMMFSLHNVRTRERRRMIGRASESSEGIGHPTASRPGGLENSGKQGPHRLNGPGCTSPSSSDQVPIIFLRNDYRGFPRSIGWRVGTVGYEIAWSSRGRG